MTFDVIDGPRLETRAAVRALGIRLITPFRGMLGVRDSLVAELSRWLDEHDADADGPFFLRLHRVDMAADMDIEVGILGAEHPGDDRVRPSEQPAGDYAILAYRGSSLQANRLLLSWPGSAGREFAADLESGAWAGRFELLRTDPRVEPRKTKWTVELAFLLTPAGRR